MSTRDDILKALDQVIDPGQRPHRGAAEHDQRPGARDGHVGFALEVAAERGPQSEPLREACEAVVRAWPASSRSPPC